MTAQNRIKVAHITTIDLSLRLLLLNQMISLREAGYEAHAISSAGPDVSALEAAGIIHHAVPISRRFSPLEDWIALWRLVAVMRRERFAIVHTHTPKPSLLGQLAARIAGVPVVINTIHGFYFHDHMRPLARRFYIAMEQIAARCSDRILSQNAEDRVTAIREHIATDGLIRVLGNGIDLTRFDSQRLDPDAVTRLRASLAIPTDAPVVGFVGRLVAEKGILELFEAAQHILVMIPHVHFLFVGIHEPDKTDGISPATAERYGIAAHCTFTGRRADMPELYALMDMLVLPSHREGFPRAPMEAAAMGLPCIVTDIRGCREVIVPGETGLFVPIQDAQALAEAILHLLQNPSLAKSMGAQGRTLANQRFDERLVFERVKQTYAELLQVKGLTHGNQ